MYGGRNASAVVAVIPPIKRSHYFLLFFAWDDQLFLRPQYVYLFFIHDAVSIKHYIAANVGMTGE